MDPNDFVADDTKAAPAPVPARTGGDSGSKDTSQEKLDDEALEAVESQDFEDRIEGEDADRAGENGDLEKRRTLSRQTTRKSIRSQERDPNMVSWNGPDDPASPKNWKSSRKWIAVFVVSSFVR